MKGRSVFEITGYIGDGVAICLDCIKPEEIKDCTPMTLGDEFDSPPSCDRCLKHIEGSCLHTNAMWEFVDENDLIHYYDGDEIILNVKLKCVCEADETDTWTYKRIKGN